MVRLAPLPKKPSNQLPTPPDGLPSPHILGAYVGHRGAGKTTAACRLIKSYPPGFFSHIYVISPTAHSQKHLFEDYLGCDPAHVYNVDGLPAVKKAMAEIIEQVGADFKHHKDDVEYVKAYHILAAGMPHLLTPQQAGLLESRDCSPPAPVRRRPAAIVLIDDLQGMRCIDTPYWTQLCVKHRHLGGGAGISLIHCVQSQKNSLSRAIRGNLSFLSLYRSHDSSVLQDYAQECSGIVPKDRFMEMFQQATQHSPHSALCIDLSASDPNRVFSRSLETFFHVQE